MHWLMFFASLWYFICIDFVSLHWILSCIYWHDSYIHQYACFWCDGLSLVAHHTELVYWNVWVVMNYRLSASPTIHICVWANFACISVRMSQFCLHWILLCSNFYIHKCVWAQFCLHLNFTLYVMRQFSHIHNTLTYDML